METDADGYPKECDKASTDVIDMDIDNDTAQKDGYNILNGSSEAKQAVSVTTSEDATNQIKGYTHEKLLHPLLGYVRGEPLDVPQNQGS